MGETTIDDQWFERIFLDGTEHYFIFPAFVVAVATGLRREGIYLRLDFILGIRHFMTSLISASGV